MKIVTAEDETLSGRTLGVDQALWGYQTVTARDGDEVPRRLQSAVVPRLAILDWAMP